MNDRSFLAELKVPAQPAFIPVAKMVAASLGGQLGFSLEEIDELKIAVAQACDSTIQEAEDMWGRDGATLKLAYSSTERGITVDVEAIGSPAASRAPARMPAPSRRPARDTIEAERALTHAMIRLFVDDFRRQVDTGQGQIRFRMVKYLIS